MESLNLKVTTGISKTRDGAQNMMLYAHTDRTQQLRRLECDPIGSLYTKNLTDIENEHGFAQVQLGTASATDTLTSSTIVPVKDANARDGWYFQNSVANTSLALKLFDGAKERLNTVAVDTFYAVMFVDSYVDITSYPRFEVFTKPTGTGDHDPTYHSKFTYSIKPPTVTGNSAMGMGEEVVFWAKARPLLNLGQRFIELSILTVLGDGASGDISKIELLSDASAPVDSIQMCINQIGWNSEISLDFKSRNVHLTIPDTSALGDATAANQALQIAQETATATSVEEINIKTSDLAKEATLATRATEATLSNVNTVLTDGTQQSKVMGVDVGLNQHQIRTSVAGRLEVDINSSSLATEATLATRATEATLATRASEATLALVASEATLATRASQATLATRASEATLATRASEATLASLDGKITTCDTGAIAGDVSVSSVGGTVAVSAISLPLPGGAATETTLASLNGKITTCDTGSIAGNVSVSSVGGTVAVSAISLPLPGGAATEATLASLNGKITTCDTGAIAGNVSVSSVGGTVAVSASSLPLPGGAATEATLDTFRTDNATNLGTLDAKLDSIISNTEKFAPSYSRTEALPVQLVCGSVGSSYNALRSNGQDLIVYIDDMNVDVSLNSGLSTAIRQDATNTKLDTIKLDTQGIETAVESIITGQKGATGEFLASHTLNNDNYSAVFELGDYRNVRFFGKWVVNTSTGMPLFGSQTSGGTYYALGMNDKLSQQSVEINGLAQYHISATLTDAPKFIKFYNNSGGNVDGIEIDYVKYM